VNRRGFLAGLFGAAAVAADPERLLWTPGRKLISIPRPMTRRELQALNDSIIDEAAIQLGRRTAWYVDRMMDQWWTEIGGLRV
jgi:hypothetical protein